MSEPDEMRLTPREVHQLEEALAVAGEVPPLPPVPYPFAGQPETYYLAVRLYLDEVAGRVVRQFPGAVQAGALIALLRADISAIRAAREKGGL